MMTIKMDYIEMPAQDLLATERFFQQAFGWQFRWFGDGYMAFERSVCGMDGGFYHTSTLTMQPSQGAALVVLYAEHLSVAQEKIVSLGATISQDTFDFPGGRRFHFLDPNGNEWAVWSDGKD